jgi:5-enolpyruvylshikimate-3-phosphate synthase
MHLLRPKDYTLVIEPPADYNSVLTACAFAAFKREPTTILNVERTAAVARLEEFLASGNIQCRWSGNGVTIDPGAKKPFEYTQRFANYDLFSYAVTMAATAAGSSVALIDDVDETVQMTVLALRRMGAELEFLGGNTSRMEVIKPVSHAIKYHLKRESAKIVPHLVLAMSTIDGRCELYDLFADSRFDYIFQHFVAGFERKSLREEEPEDELERRLRKRMPTPTGEYRSHVTIAGGIDASAATITLRPDVELAAYLVAGVDNYSRGRLILRNFSSVDISDTPLGQLRRMGVEFVPYNQDGINGYLVKKSAVKGRRVAYEQMHDYPDAVGALALAASVGEGTSVIRSSPYNTNREEARRRRLCDIIRSLGAKIAEIDDGLVVEGAKELSADLVKTEEDALCALLVTAAALGVVDRIEVDDISAGATRWGESFEKLLHLVSPPVKEPAT